MGKSVPSQGPVPQLPPAQRTERLVPTSTPPPRTESSPQRASAETFTPTAAQVNAAKRGEEIRRAGQPGGTTGTRFSNVSDPEVSSSNLKKPTASSAPVANKLLTSEASGAVTFQQGGLGNRIYKFGKHNTIIGGR